MSWLILSELSTTCPELTAIIKKTRLQGQKGRLTTSDDPEAEELRDEIKELKARIKELTEFKRASNSSHQPMNPILVDQN